jgi:hypothetical protein
VKYFILIPLLLASFYPFSFAMYSWKKKNRTASVGVILLTVAAIFLPCMLLFVK